METIALRADPDDLVSLAAFVELWWARDVPARRGDGSDTDLREFLDRKQAALRMLRGNRSGFPDPSGPASSSQTWGRARLYRLGDLVSWTATASGDDRPVSEVLTERSGLVAPLWHLWRSLDACAVQMGPARCRRFSVAAVTALAVTGVKPAAGRLAADVTELLDAGDDALKSLAVIVGRAEEKTPELQGVFQALLDARPRRSPAAGRAVRAAAATIIAGYDPAPLLELILDPPGTPRGTSSAAGTPAALTKLMVAAGDPHPGEAVLDPASGEGNLLLHAAEQADSSVTLIGIEPDASAWAVAKSRFYLRGIAADLRLGLSLGGPHPPPDADLVLVDPPLDTRRDYRRWLSLAAQCCQPEGRAIVALPAISAASGRREWRDLGAERADLIIRCTSRLRTDRGDALVLWGLRPEPGDQILLVDATNLGRRRDTLTDIEAEEAELLRDVIRQWRNTGRIQATGSLAVTAIPREEITNGHADLLGDDRLAASRPAGTDAAITEALTLARQLEALIDGPVRPRTAAEHRRALKRLIQRLESQAPTS